MNKLRRGFIVAALFAIAVAMIAAGTAGAALKLPEPGGYVNDFAGMLSSQTVDEFEAKLTQYEKETGNEIAVVTVENLQGTTVEDFAVRLFEKWQIGKKGKDNGVLLVVAEDEREMRIEVGYGLEPDLTDAESHQIITNVITPAFKAGDFDKGVSDGVDAIVATIAGEAVPALETDSRREPGGDLAWFLYILGFVVFGGLQWVGAVLARTKSWWLGGLLGFLIGLLIALFSVAIGIIAIIVLTPLGLILDFFVSHAYQEFKKHEHDKKKSRKSDHVPWWAGGGWGPGGGGGGFGGFGGGGSGGGGASGRW
ncbi:MAG: hypothetical protein A2074_07990 [Candidatus Aquicultor primus]|uniref:TPM domain-containing protein n=1 Tax=Candidatus Aquicultor primus TaxID=1797195 RepID=A0A1F2USJ7_9ACTN|nr:MAG: hypothetical protein A2074_07990 [Candidatus Aquicultor primus]